MASLLQPPFEVSEVDPSGSADDAQAALQDDQADVGHRRRPGPATRRLRERLRAVHRADRRRRPEQGQRQPMGGGVTIDVLFNPDLKTSWVMVPALDRADPRVHRHDHHQPRAGRANARTGTLEQLAVMPFRPCGRDHRQDRALLRAGRGRHGRWSRCWASCSSACRSTAGCCSSRSAPAVFLLVVLGHRRAHLDGRRRTRARPSRRPSCCLMPQILLSGMIFPLSSMPWGVRWIGYLLPLTYFINRSPRGSCCGARRSRRCGRRSWFWR